MDKPRKSNKKHRDEQRRAAPESLRFLFKTEEEESLANTEDASMPSLRTQWEMAEAGFNEWVSKSPIDLAREMDNLPGPHELPKSARERRAASMLRIISSRLLD